MPARLAHAAAGDRAHDVRRAQDAAVGDRGVRARHLHRRDELALADRQVAHRGARVLVERRAPGPVPRPAGRRRWARRSRSGAPSVLKRAAPSRSADLDRADVARAGEDLRGRERFFGVFGVVVDRAVGDLDLVGDVERVSGVIRPSCRAPETVTDLERRAGFVVEAHRAVLQRRRRGAAPGSLALTCGQLASSEDRAAARVHHDRGGVFRAEHAADRREHVFGALLDVRVERQRRARRPGPRGAFR